MQNFINSYRKSSFQVIFRTPSVLKFPAEIIPSQKNFSSQRKPWEMTQQTAYRSHSSAMNRKTSQLSLKNSRISTANP